MDIKDFKVGETAYLMNFHGRMPNENTTTIDEVVVTSVGKKYVKVKYPKFNYNTGFFQRNPEDCHLVEKVTCGQENYLFHTKEDIDEYKKRKELSKWICDKVQYIIHKRKSIYCRTIPRNQKDFGKS